MPFYTEEIDAIFRQANVDRLQCGWTDESFLKQQGELLPGVYLWSIRPTGRQILVEAVARHPEIPSAVVYRECRTT
jgi:hypothetical protein